MSDDGGLKEAFDRNVEAIEKEWSAMLPITDMILDAWRKINQEEMNEEHMRVSNP